MGWTMTEMVPWTKGSRTAMAMARLIAWNTQTAMQAKPLEIWEPVAVRQPRIRPLIGVG